MSNSCNPMDCSLPGLLCPWDSPGKNTEWVAISFSRGYSQPRNGTWVSCIADRFFRDWATTEALLQCYTMLYILSYTMFSSLQSLSCVWLFATPWIAARQASLSIMNSWSLLKLMSIKSVMPAISSSVIPFSSCPQSLPTSESFPMSQLFTWGGQSTGVSALASILPMNTQDWSLLEWTGWISLQSKGLSRVFSNTTVQKHQFFRHSAFFTVQLSHPYMTTGKTIALTRRTFVGKVTSLLLNMLSIQC